MESPLLRAGVAAAQLALSVSPKPKKEEQGDDNKADTTKKEIKTEVKAEGFQDPWLNVKSCFFLCAVMLLCFWHFFLL